MSDLLERCQRSLYQARKAVFGLDPPPQFDDGKNIDTELINYVYPEQLKPHSSSDCEQRIRELIQPLFWEWRDFRAILTNLAFIRERNYLPAAHIPRVIYIDGLLPVVHELVKISNAHKKAEVSRSIFADRERFCLIQSGITRIGSETSVGVDISPETDRAYLQTPIINIHLHPLVTGSFLLSHLDYIAFLSESRLIVMIVSNSQDIMLAMKTSATRETVDPFGVRQHISATLQDMEEKRGGLKSPKFELMLNKAICTEFGLVLFRTTGGKKNIARHVNVVE